MPRKVMLDPERRVKGPPLTPAQEAFVREHMQLANTIAQVFISKSPSRFEGDLRSAALEGLIKAALKFDESLGVPFEGWAKIKIEGAIKDEVRKLIAPRIRSKVRRPLPVDTAALPNHLVPVSRERADMIHHDERRVVELISSIRHPDAREVAIEFWLKGREYSEIARDTGVDESRISQLWTKARSEMREFIEQEPQLRRTIVTKSKRRIGRTQVAAVKKIAPEEWRAAYEKHMNGVEAIQIAKELDIATSTLYRYWAINGLETRAANAPAADRLQAAQRA